NFAALVSWKIDAAPLALSRGAIATRGPAAPPKISVQVSDARFANADAQGDFKAGWSTGAGDVAAGRARGARFPGRLELEGRITSAEAARTARYLPLGLPQHTHEYVPHAVH